jgi:gamma-glutamyltranspeptidase/glutathione hydrolase
LDGDGNVVAMGLTINDPFGAKLLVREAGIILNNSMARFAIPVDGSEAANESLPNGLKPRKRPVSGVTPTILLQRDQPVLVVGASGGSRITSAVLQTILNVLDFDMPLKQAISAPRLHVEPGTEPVVVVEPGVGQKVMAGLAAKGHRVRKESSLGEVEAIQIEGPAITEQSDPRLLP